MLKINKKGQLFAVLVDDWKLLRNKSRTPSSVGVTMSASSAGVKMSPSSAGVNMSQSSGGLKMSPLIFLDAESILILGTKIFIFFIVHFQVKL